MDCKHRKNGLPALLGSLLFMTSVVHAIPIPKSETVPPDTPTNVELEFIACNKLEISWDNIADAPSTPATGLKQYRISRKPTPYTAKHVATTQGEPDGVLTHRRRYIANTSDWEEQVIQIHVNASDHDRNISGSEGYQSIVRPSPSSQLCADTLPPPRPTLTLEDEGGCKGPVLSVENYDTSDIRRFRFYRGYQEIGGDFNFETVDDYGIIPGKSYLYRVAAEDDAGNLSPISWPYGYTVPEYCAPSDNLGLLDVIAIYARFSNTGSPVHTPAELRELITGDGSGAANLADFVNEASNRNTVIQLVDDFGVTTLPRDGEAYGCTWVAEHNAWRSCSNKPLMRDDLFAIHGISPTDADRFVIFVDGLLDASAGGNTLTMKSRGSLDRTLTTLAHEFMHTFGIEHGAGDRRCPGYGDIGPGGNDFSFGCDGGLRTYGDDYNVMGIANLRHPSAYQKVRAGFLAPFETLELSEDLVSYRLANSGGSDGGIKHLLLTRTVDGEPVTYSIEYRHASGYNGSLGRMGHVPQPTSLQIRQLVPRYIVGAVDTVLIKLLTEDEPFYFDPVMNVGFTFSASDPFGTFVTTCGISSPCDESWQEYNPWNNDD